MRRKSNSNVVTPLAVPVASVICGTAWLLLCSIPASLATEAVETTIQQRSLIGDNTAIVNNILEDPSAAAGEYTKKFKLQPRQPLKGGAVPSSNQQLEQQSRTLRRDPEDDEPEESNEEEQQSQLVLKRQRGNRNRRRGGGGGGKRKKKNTSNQLANRGRQRRGNPPGINKRKNGGKNNGGKPSGYNKNNRMCPCPGWESTTTNPYGYRKLQFYGGFSGSSKGFKPKYRNDMTWWGGSSGKWGGGNTWSGTVANAWWSQDWGNNAWWSQGNAWQSNSWGMKWCPCPTDPPTPKPTKQPTDMPTYPPTYEPTTPPPTPAPTNPPTWWSDPWGSTKPPSWGSTKPPSKWGTTKPPSKWGATKPPSKWGDWWGPKETDPPTQMPTTETPTQLPSAMPTYRPTGPPDLPSCEWFFWGADEARGGILADDQKVPYLYEFPTVVDLSSGSRHIFIIEKQGIAMVAGFIESNTAYGGHLGIPDWKQGSNDLTPIEEVAIYNETVVEKVPPPRFTRVFAGAGTPGNSRDMHSILISEDGDVFTTGNNNKGQLCLGDQKHRFIPHHVSSLPGPARAAAVGLDFTLILLEDGSVWGCGSNLNGQIGLSKPIHQSLLPVEIPTARNIVDVSTGWAYSLFQDDAGNVFGTGSNLFSQMCKTTEGDPLFAPELIGGIKDVQQIYAGSESSYFLLEDGSVKACGRNDQGQLGDGTFFQKDKAVNVKVKETIKMIGAGPSAQSVFFVGEEPGVIFAAGIDDRFQLGLGFTEAATAIPTEVDFGEDASLYNFTKVTASGTNTAARVCLLEAPTFTPTSYPTDLPTANPTIFPTEVPTQNPTESTDEPTLYPTAYPTAYPTQNPTEATDEPTANPTMAPPGWWFWGAQEGEGGQLGNNQKVPIFYEDTVIDLSAGSRHSFLIDESGNAYAAGFIESDFSYKGHLGVDDWEEGSNQGKQVDKVIDTSGKTVNAPRFMKAYAGAGVPSDSGEMHSMLIDEDGNVYLSGRNSKGQLCLGDRKDRYEFSQVDGLPRRAVAGSILFEATLILLEDGSVWGCGSNEFGELGLGPNIDFTDTPDNRNGLKNIIDLASGYKFGIFLDEDNVVYGTGGNIYGQQCFFTEGEPAMRPTPEILNKVPGTVVQVAASRESSYYLFKDGSAVSCGRNDEGQLGDGTFINTSKDKPIVKVKLKNKIRKIGTGPSAQSVFFVTDDSVYGAGINDRFQLGINEMGSQEFPVLVDFNSDVEIDVISASGTHTLASGNFV